MGEKANGAASLGGSKKEYIRECALYRKIFSTVVLDSDVNLATLHPLSIIQESVLLSALMDLTPLSKKSLILRILSVRAKW